MNKISVLPPDVVSRIAAGEVIERPSSVVKELVENSLDAGSSSVSIELKSAGKTLIAVRDDGSGIAQDGVESLFQRHATSKISSAEDLFDIHSLGFRGEALYSVAAVSDVTLSSKSGSDEHGWETHVRAGERLTLKPAAVRQGTSIEVKELFFNTPARRKFLKSNAAELNAVIDVFLPYCLLFPEKRFSLKSDSKSFIDLRPVKGFIPRIAQALNLETKDLIEGERQYRDISLHVVLGDINVQRGRKDMQFVFINGRPVSNRTVSFHVNEIYRLMLSPGVYPFFCVFITMPPSELDVNVHPAKREVKLRDDIALVSVLRPFVEELLMTRSKPRQSAPFAVPEMKTGPAAQTTEIPGIKEPEKGYGKALEESLALFKTGLAQEKDAGLKEKLRQARYLGNLLRRYLLFETEDSLLLVDQHAAQERITFERLTRQIEKGKVEVQPLLAPELLKLSPQELVLWKENSETLKKTGFETTLYDPVTLAVHSHPALITDVAQSVRNLLSGEPISKLSPERIARMACRSSVMFGFAMNPEQAEFQRKSLLLCDAPFACPHGRPTVIEIKEETLRKQFLRP